MIRGIRFVLLTILDDGKEYDSALLSDKGWIIANFMVRDTVTIIQGVGAYITVEILFMAGLRWEVELFPGNTNQSS